MDLDGDGIGDILSGSYDGELYFFKGKGKREFAAPVKLQRDGQNINLGASSTVFAIRVKGKSKVELELEARLRDMQVTSAVLTPDEILENYNLGVS